MILAPDAAAIDEAVARLRARGLIGLPTETVYGLAGDAENTHAVARIFAIKGRPATHPVIVHLASPDNIDDWARDVSDDARRLLAAFAPGPLTVIVRRGARVLDVVTGGQDTVGLRFPSHPVAQAVLRAFGGGLAAPSANRFGRISATTAQHVADEFAHLADDDMPLVLDGGACDVGIESTIIDLSQGRAALLRPGGLGASDVVRVLGYMPETRGAASARVSGDLASHYSPQTPTRRVEASALPAEALAAGARSAGERSAAGERGAAGDAGIAVLARTVACPHGVRGLWRQAPLDAAGFARALYAELRVLDASGADMILVEAPPDGADWHAVGDRLRRATHDTESRLAADSAEAQARSRRHG